MALERISSMKKMLITGATGFVGSRVAEYYKNNYEILAPTHEEMNITEEASVLQYFKTYKPDIVVHCAAISDVGTCERDPEYSWQVNVIGTENIVKAAKEVSAICVCCSSDQVYCGVATEQPNAEESVVHPTNVYGKEKAYAEQSCLAIYKDSIHLRLAWMYDAKDTKRMDFIKQLQACAMKEKEIVFSPKDKRGITDVWEVVKNMEKVFRLPGGIYHFGSPNDKTTYETVLSIFKKKGYDTSFVREMEYANPRNLTMSQEKINQYGIYFSDTVEGVLKVWDVNV